MTAPHIDLTRRGTPRRNKTYQRTPKAAREAAIRQCLLEGISDPVELAKRLGCTKELILYYARRMPDLQLEPWKPLPTVRWRTRLAWKIGGKKAKRL